ncbi:MAG: hypothetical protein HZC54_06270 [Verrucomicrobia bacterium]|nr:hypothetical protein [Verrucomicrobiota bacterium]
MDDQGRWKNVFKEGATKEPGRRLRASGLWVWLCLGFALAAISPSLRAADNIWTNLGGGYWDTVGVWSLGIRPTNSHNIFITNATTKTVTMDSTTSGSYPASLTIYNLSLWGPAGTINTLYLNNSGLAVPLTVSNDFTLSTGGVLRVNNGAVNVLSSGSGQFTVDGVVRLDSGTITVTNSLTVIGNNGDGVVTNSAGLMSLRDVRVGNAAGSEGRWFIAGGTNQLTAISYIGYSAGATGAVVVNGGRLLASNAALFVGYNGTGSLIMSNGLTMLDRAQIGFNSGGRGSMVLAGGTNQILERTYLGFNAGGTGIVAISGGEWIATNDISYVGSSSFGSFAVSNGLARLGRVYLGYNAGAEGLMTIAGGTTYATNALGTTLFEVRRGTLTLTGGTLEVDQLLMTNTAEASLALFDGALRTRGMTNGAAMVVGNGVGGRMDWELLAGTHWLGGALTLGDVAGATGAVTLLGGELIATNAATAVGNNGRGLLTITNASLLTTTNAYVGYGATSTGSVVTVAGDGSLWTVIGSLRVGWNSSSNRLAIISGGTVAALNSHVGYDDLSSNNNVLVSGSGSVWSNAEYLAIGQGGSRNSLIISNGGSVISAYGRLGYAVSSSNNTALITGAGSIWSNSGSFRVGYSGSGNRLTITNGGWVVSADGYIGTDANSSNNSVLVTGAGSVWSNTANLYVGYGGPSNRLTIASAGRVYAPNLVIGVQAGADDNLLTNSGGYLFVTNAAGTATLDVRRGLLALSGGTTTVDRLIVTNAAGQMTFNGGTLNSRYTLFTNGAELIVGDTGGGATFNALGGQHGFSNGLVVGNGGYGNSFNITNTAQVTVNGDTVIGKAVTADNNTARVSGAGSLWNGSGGLYVGNGGASNELSILNGAVVSNAFGLIGYVDNWNAVVVSGNGSLWNNSGTLEVGRSGNINTLSILDGGVVNNGYGIIGTEASGVGNKVFVSGTGSVWNNTMLYVGSTGRSSKLSVLNGAVVNSDQCLVGFDGQLNSVLVSGTGSVLNCALMLGVGWGDISNTLLVQSGGVVRTFHGIIGNLETADGNSVTISDVGSLWSNGGSINVGRLGSANNLTISNGAQLVIATGRCSIGVAPDSFANTMLVTGTGSICDIAQNLYVGESGYDNRLLITRGGVVVARTGAIVGEQASAIGNAIELTEGTLLVTNSSGTASLDVRRGWLALNSGTVTVNRLILTNAAGVVAFSSGTFNSGGTLVSNGEPFSIGDEGGGATFNALGGQHSFSNDLIVGEYGDGNSLNITNAALVTVEGYARIGAMIGSMSNIVTVSGAGSVWSNSAGLYVGHFGTYNQLAILDRGVVAATQVVVGATAYSSNNTLTVNGGHLFATNAAGGSALNVLRGAFTLISGTVTVNRLYATNGAASVIVFNGGTLNSGSSLVSNGAAFIVGDTGNGATFNALGGQHGFSNGLTIGSSGYGNLLSITNGAQVVVSGMSVIGEDSIADNNTVIVSGAGSVWNNNGDLRVGYFGASNVLSILDGAMTRNTDAYIGFDTDANNNAVAVIGPGSVWSNSGNLRVSYNNNFGNNLTIANSGQVFDAAGYIGSWSGDSRSNWVLVTGTNSIWRNSGSVFVGDEGHDNTLTISSGGQVLNTDGYIGNNASASNNAVLVSGTGSVWSNTASICVGDYGSFNQLAIQSGGVVNSASGVIGQNAGANNNAVLVSGTGSVWKNSAIVIGSYGSFNQLAIQSGGVVSNGFASLGYGALASNNAVWVSGTGSIWNNTSFIRVGEAGSSNQLVIQSGGVVSSLHGDIGYSASASNNAVQVSGSGSAWNNKGFLYVGRAGSHNQFAIQSGGVVSNTSGYIGQNAGANNNAVLVSGGGSVWNNSGSLYVGWSGSFNRLSILSGGVVSNTEDFLGNTDGFIGYDALASNNAVLVSGSGSVWNNRGDLRVGLYGSFNQLAIQGGGLVSNRSASLGFDTSSSNNAVMVSGSGSVWNNSEELNVGYSGSSNQLSIMDGALVNSAISYIGRTYTTNNSVLVSGTGSVWNSGSELRVGNSGSSNTLSILEGGAVSNANGYIGRNAGAKNNAVLVSGSGSVWSNSGELSVGFFGSSSALSILEGGAVSSSTGSIGYNTSDNVVLVSGTGSVWNNSGSLSVGHSGSSNQLNIQNSGTVLATNVVLGGTYFSAANALMVAGGLLIVTNATAGGALDVRRGTFTLNSGTVTVDRLLATNGAASVIAFNNGTLTTRGSTVSNGNYFLVGDGLGSAQMILAGGTHNYANGLRVNTNALVISEGATITNSVFGSTLVNFGSVEGRGTIHSRVGNEGTITATGGTLRLAGGFTNGSSGPVNAGLLRAIGTGSELRVDMPFHNAATVVASNNATVTFAGAFQNAGTVRIANQSLATFQTAATNTGTISVQSQSTARFDVGLTNNGTLAFGPTLNPSTVIITGTLTLGSGGIITMSHTNDTLVMRGNFNNVSTDTNNFNMRWGVMTFGGTASGVTNTFEVASTNKGAVFSGFDRNMALGTLNITNHISFVNQINNGGGLGTNEALYVDVLHLFNGATMKLSQLTVYVGMQFIYEDANGAKVLTGLAGDAITQFNKDSLGLANVFLDNGGQIVFVPEPGVASLLLAGALALTLGMRRRPRHG